MNDTAFSGNGKVSYIPVITGTNPKPITNADRIRAMNDEELAEWLSHAWHKSWYTLQEWLDWLKSQVEVDE